MVLYPRSAFGGGIIFVLGLIRFNWYSMDSRFLQNLAPITIEGIPRPHKRARHTPDLIPAAISVASENYLCTLTTPSDFPRLIILTYDYPNPPHSMKI